MPKIDEYTGSNTFPTLPNNSEIETKIKKDTVKKESKEDKTNFKEDKTNFKNDKINFKEDKNIFKVSKNLQVNQPTILIEISETDKKVQASVQASDLKNASESLAKELNRAIKIMNSIPHGESAPGGRLTTGICAAFAFQCVDHVNKFGNQEVIPPLITDKIPDQMKCAELRLPQAIYQSLSKGEQYGDAQFGKNTALANKACQTFNKLITAESGLHVTGQYPLKKEAESKEKQDKPTEVRDFSPSVSIDKMGVMIDDLAKGDVGKQGQHHVILFRKPGQNLTEHHVIYINFEKGIIGDGATGLLWKVPSENKDAFVPLIKTYIQNQYKKSDWEEVSALTLEKGAHPSELPLALRKIGMYSSILYNMARTEGITESVKAGYGFLAGNSTLQSTGRVIKAVWNPVGKVLSIGPSAVSSLYHLGKSACSKNQRQLSLVAACKNEKVTTAKLLLKMGADPNLPDPITKQSPIEIAVKSKNIELVQALLEARADVNLKTSDQNSLLFIPINWPDEKMVELLLKHGAKVKDNSYSGDYTLERAVKNRSLSNIKQLVEKDPSIVEGANGAYFIPRIISNHGVAGVELLLKHGAKPDKKCLGEAIWFGNKDVLTLLIKAGLTPTVKNLEYACKMGRKDIVEYLIKQQGIKPNQDCLYAACTSFQDNEEIIELLFSQGVEPNLKALGRACKAQGVAVAKLIISKGIKPTTKCLSLACQYTEDPNLIELLEKEGLQIDPESLNAALLNVRSNSILKYMVENHPNLLKMNQFNLDLNSASFKKIDSPLLYSIKIFLREIELDRSNYKLALNNIKLLVSQGLKLTKEEIDYIKEIERRDLENRRISRVISFQDLLILFPKELGS